MKTSILLGALATFAAVLLYGLLHSWLASRRVKGWSRANFGSGHDRFYRLFFNILGGITFLPALLAAWLAPSLTLHQIQPPWLWLTLGLQGLAILALIVGVQQTNAAEFLGVSQLLGLESESANLTRSGLYRWVRHPLYTAGLVFIWLTPIMSTNILALNLGISLYLYVGSIYEERKMVEEWGEDYRRYQRNVPRLIPLPWKHAQEQH